MKKTFPSIALTAIVLLAPQLVTTGAAAEGEPGPLDSPDRGWRRGPASYLLTRDEAADFKKLKTDEERAGFIEQFWARRDPTPGTEVNEFKERYAARLAEVEKTFAPPAGRGWEEDRGMVVLLLGTPDEIRTSGGGGGAAPPDAGAAPIPGSTSALETGAGLAPRPRSVFVYTHEVYPGMETPLELEFIGESAGGYRLLSKLDTENPKINGLEPLPPPAPPAAIASGAQGGTDLPGSGAAPVEPPPPAEPTAQEALLSELAAGTAATSEIGVATRLDFYKTQGPETLTTLTVELEGSGSQIILAAQLVDMDEKVAVSFDDEDSFAPAGEEAAGPSTVFQAAHNVAPGSYSMVTAVRDAGSGKIGWVREDIEVPDFTTEGLQISSVTLARKVQQIQGSQDSSDRFVLGNLRVIPAPDPVFHAGEELGLYFQIYNTSSDPASGKPRLKISYKFEKVEAKRKIPLGREPIVQEANTAVQAFAVTIAPSWPGGDYQVEVKVEDVASGATTSVIVPFKVEKEG